MRFLLHGNLPPDVADALLKHGHAIDKTDVSAEVLKFAHQKQLDIVTSDAELAHAKVSFSRSIVFLQDQQAGAIDRLFARYKRLSLGRVYTVTKTRVKVRQLPRA